MKTYLITGGSGFIGSHLVSALLKSGNKVINIDNFNNFYDPSIKIINTFESLSINYNKKNKIDIENLPEIVNNKNYKLEIADIRDYNKIESVFSENKIDFVIHLAANAGVRPSIQNPILYEEVNIKGTLNLLELCAKYNINKFIFASSSSVYGNNSKVPFSENDNVDFPISPYAATKKSCELLIYTYHSLYKINTVILRFFTVYGERQRPDLAIHKFTRLICNNKPISIFGNGHTKRDYTYIDDIINGILKSILYIENNSNIYEILNLGENNTVELIYLVSLLEKNIGKKANINWLPMQSGDVNITYADISKARQIINYSPKIQIEDGIKKFINWYMINNYREEI